MSGQMKVDFPPADDAVVRSVLTRFMHLEAQAKEKVAVATDKSENPEYLPWESLKYKKWLPEGFSAEEFWQLVKAIRSNELKKTPLVDEAGQPFLWCRLDRYDEFLHQLDMAMGGLHSRADHLGAKKQNRYYVDGLIEEAIASSQLEGAHTTRREALKIILESRDPADKHQRMIVNNHQAMQKIKHQWKDEALSVSLILDMHRLLTRDAIDNGHAGVFRKDEDGIIVQGQDNDEIAFIPPKMGCVARELKRFIDFANDDLGEAFIHPVIKAIMLHFYFAWLHPFCDGNGRMARCIFYWYLLRKGYAAFAYIPLSMRIKESPKQYGRAYLYSEQDDNDLTYFIDYNIRQLQLAKKDYEAYLVGRGEQEEEEKKIEIGGDYKFNGRQQQLIRHYMKDAQARTNVSSYSKVNQVTPVTAGRDLKYLEENGLVRSEKRGRNVFYYATDKLRQLVVDT